jgi:hypothetical protein
MNLPLLHKQEVANSIINAIIELSW